MPNATTRGWFTTPDENAIPDMEMWLLDLAQQIEDRMAVHDPQRGAVSINVSGAPGASGTITFPEAYAGVPTVYLTTRDSSFFATHGTPTATNVGFSVRHVDNIAVTNTVVVDWLAMGPGQ